MILLTFDVLGFFIFAVSIQICYFPWGLLKAVLVFSPYLTIFMVFRSIILISEASDGALWVSWYGDDGSRHHKGGAEEYEGA